MERLSYFSDICQWPILCFVGMIAPWNMLAIADQTPGQQPLSARALCGVAVGWVATRNRYPPGRGLWLPGWLCAQDFHFWHFTVRSVFVEGQ